MEQDPDRYRKQDDRAQPLPRPSQVVGLDRVNRNHKIIAEPRITQKGEVFGIMFAQPAEEGDHTQNQDDEGDKQINGEHGVEFNNRPARFMPDEIRPEPLQAGPNETEPGLDGGPKIGFGRGQFAEQESEIKRHYAPNHRDILERRDNELNERSPIMTAH